MAIRLLLIDDHQLLTDSWTQLFNSTPGYSVAGACNNSDGCLQMIAQTQPDIVLVDICIEPVDGIALTKAIRQQFPLQKLIGVSLYNVVVYVKKMMAAGAQGYITKGSGKDELLMAVDKVYAGEKYICREMREIAEGESAATDTFSVALNQLTRRELDIINLIKEGLSSKEIAEHLDISFKTVEAHRYNILRKLGIHNTAEMVNKMMQRGF